MFPEISARWSLLEASFRYLSPGIEGEKCRSLDHTWQIPFIHSVQFLITCHFYIYMKVLPVISSMWYVKVRLCTTGVWQLRMCFSNTLCPRLRTIIQDLLTSILYVLARIATKYMKFLYRHLLNKRNSSSSCAFILNFCRRVVLQAKILKKRLHGAKKSGVRVVFGVFLALKRPSPKLTILLYYSLCNMASFANFQNFVLFEYYLFFFSRFLHATYLSRFSSSRSNYVPTCLHI